MHVLLDCTAIPANRGGVGRYIEGILTGWNDSQAAGQSVPDITIVSHAEDAEPLGSLYPAARVVTVPRSLRSTSRRLLWEQWGLPRLAKQLGIDVIHSPHYTYPAFTRAKRVVTLHDATFFSDPEVHSAVKVRFFRLWTRLAWRRADAIIVPSQATYDEIRRFIGQPRAAIHVALHGVDRTVFHPPADEELQAFRHEQGISTDERWIAFLGTIEPRKNVPNLIRANTLLSETLGDEAPTLLIAGGRGWDATAAGMLDEAPSHPEWRTRELGYLPLDQLRCLLGGAAVVVYPSSAEGFGLPVLEAMATGTAVLTTRRLALPEVGGDAVAYSEPDTDSLIESLTMLLTSDTSKLRAAALARAGTLSWRSSAEIHTATYRSVLSSEVTTGD